MKSTIIVNGTNQIVLKPETPLEILVVKGLQNKPLISKYHESTQILGESSPNCLVVSPIEGVLEEEIEPVLMAIIDCHQQNKILGLIPDNTSPANLLEFIKQRIGANQIELRPGEQIAPNQSFHATITTINNNETDVVDGEFAAMGVNIYKQW